MKDHYNDMVNGEFQQDGYSGSPGRFWLSLNSDKPSQLSGWKFRLSVSPEDTEKAWNIAVDVMASDAHVSTYRAKVASPHGKEVLSNPDHPQAGKMITIYGDQNVDPVLYQKMLLRLHDALEEADIKPGFYVDGDRRIPGSAYLSYRNDGTGNGRGNYNAAANNANITEIRRYNPDNDEDPYKDFYLGAEAAVLTAESHADMRLGTWQQSQTKGGKLIVRTPVCEQQAEAVVHALCRQGFAPTMRESETLGTTIRLEEDDAKRLYKMQERACEALKMGTWQSAKVSLKGQHVKITRTHVANEAEEKALIDKLRENGFRPVTAESASLGKTVRLVGPDAQRMERMQEQHRVRVSQLVGDKAYVPTVMIERQPPAPPPKNKL